MSTALPVRPAAFLLALTALLGLLGGCDASPPSEKANAAIKEAVLDSNPQVYRGGDAAAEVTGITIKGWKKAEGMNGQQGSPVGYASDWSAKFRAKEPLAYILVEIDGTKIVEVIADKGTEVPFTGRVSALQYDGKWEVSAFDSGDFEKDAWTPLWNKIGGVTMGYNSISANGSQAVGRGPALQPLSALKPYAIQGSDEEKKIMAAVNERNQKAQEAAMAANEARRVANEAAQKLRQEEYQANLKKQQEAADAARAAQQAAYAEQQRVAAEAAKARAAEAAAKAVEARRAKIVPMVAPFKNVHGVVMTADAGQTLGSVILSAAVDDATFKATGTGIDLRTMPFREYTFEATADDRAGVSFTSPLVAAPIVFGVAGPNLVSRAAGLTASPLNDADRAKLDAHIAQGKRLGSAAPQVFTPQILTAADAKAREATMTGGNGGQTTPLVGVVLYKDRNGPTVLPMFAGDLAANKTYKWAKETIALRVLEPVKGTFLYVRAANAPTDNLVVVINGVHRCQIDAIEKMGGALIPLPEGFEILDLRLDALGTAQVRGVMLVK